MTKLAPLEYMRRCEEVDDLSQRTQDAHLLSPNDLRELRAKLVALLHRLENDLP